MDQQPKPSIGPQDILFTLFRHKWKIVIFGLLGIAAAAAVWVIQKPLFYSRAKLLVRYVTETRDILESPDGPDVIRDPDTRGTTIINSEIEILSSQDAFVQVARQLGPERILQAHGGGTNLFQAAGTLRKELTVDVGRNSSVIVASLGHLDPVIAREALDALVKEYLRRHVDIHRAVGTYDMLQASTAELRNRLNQTEKELRDQKARANIIDLPQAKADLAQQRSSIREAIFMAETELAELRAQLGETPASAPDAVTRTNQMAENAAEPIGPPASTNLPAIILPSARERAEYERLSVQLSSLLTSRDEALRTFHPESTLVKRLEEQIASLESSISELGFDPAAVAPSAGAPNASLAAGSDPAEIKGRIRAVEARLSVLNRRSEEILAQVRLIDDVEARILDLERRRQIDDEKLRYFESSLEQARFDQAIDAGKLNNIGIVQAPTPAVPDTGKLYKLIAGVFAGFCGMGLALVFALDLFLDPAVKRVKDIENLRLPVFATVPCLRPASANRSRRSQKNDPDSGQTGLERPEIAPWDESDPMLPYYEAIRDRIVMSYAGDLHKPKIVGLTSCNSGAGVTRLALGLAASLSRDVERNILFIGLEQNKVSLTAFTKGRPEALPSGEVQADSDPSPQSSIENHQSEIPPASDLSDLRDSVVNNDLEANLISLARTGRNTTGASVVQSFSDLMPRLKTSDYDYIIFDLPPVTQTSGSLRLASQMERALMVVEADKTSKDKIERVKKLINGSPNKIATILNKTKTYGPKSLTPDL